MKTPAEMLKLAEKATKGPWISNFEPSSETKNNKPYFRKIYITKDIGDNETMLIAKMNWPSYPGKSESIPNAEFIAASREFVPWASQRLIEVEDILKDAAETIKSYQRKCESHAGIIQINRIKQFLEVSDEPNH